MKNYRNKIKCGVYLVVDPSMDEVKLLKTLKKVASTNIAAVQIWDHFKKRTGVEELVQKICTICQAEDIPVLINNRWEFLKSLPLNGVHFDEIPNDYERFEKEIKRNFIIGLTCGNDIKVVEWASRKKIDYISFCSMFPSPSVGNCEIVDFETVQKAREVFSDKLFLAGGISPENIQKLTPLAYDGVAVISGIMKAENPVEAVKKYQQELRN